MKHRSIKLSESDGMVYTDVEVNDYVTDQLRLRVVVDRGTPKIQAISITLTQARMIRDAMLLLYPNM